MQVYQDYKRKAPGKRTQRTPHHTAQASRALQANRPSPPPSAAQTLTTQDTASIVLPLAKPRPLALIGKGQVMKGSTP